MAIWHNFLSVLGLGDIVNPDRGAQRAGPSHGATEARISVTDERAMQLSAVWACVRLITMSVSTLPLHVFRRTNDGRDRVTNHYLDRLFNVSPNPFMTGKQFRAAMTAQLALWGNAYARIKRDAAGRPTAVVPLKPGHVTPVRTTQGLKYEYQTDTGRRTFQQGSILHLKCMTVDGVIGLSPLAYARQSLGITVAADRSAATAFQGVPNGVMKTPNFLTQEQRDSMRGVYGNVSQATGDDGHWWLLEGGIDFEAIGIPPNDLQMLESRQFQVSEICRFFGVPAVMVDGAAGATAAWPASYEQQVLSFLTFTLDPYLEAWEDSIKASLLAPPDRRSVYAEHNVEGLLRADSEARGSFYATMAQNAIMSRNEIRAKENLPPVEGGDELTAQINLAPIQDLGGDPTDEGVSN
jgi:HK97 family phage portal protein